MNKNPFNFSKPVGGTDFYNRKDETELAIGFLKQLQSFSITGEERIGRTSFLKHILSKEVLKAHGMDPEKYIMVYFDKGSPYEITKDALIEFLVKKIEEQIQFEIEARDVFEKLHTYVERLISHGKNIVIALDDFEILEPVLDAHFSHWLRSIFQKPNVMAITASQKTMKELLEKLGAMTSPLYNIFGNLTMGLFSRKETEKMIQDIFLKSKIELTKKEISLLADLSGGHPCLIQLVGFYYYVEKKKKKEIDYDEFESEMSYYAKNQSISMKTTARPWKENILVCVSLSSLISILVLTVLSDQFSSIRRVPEIFLPEIGIGTLIRSLVVLVLTFFISYYILGKIQTVQSLLDRSKFWIFSKEKLWVIPILLLFILCYILEGFTGFISAVLTYLFLKAWFNVGRPNDNNR